MIDVKEEDDGTFTIEWDENDPQESIFNDFTEEDFNQMLLTYAKEIIASGDTGEESQNININTATQEDWEDFWKEEV